MKKRVLILCLLAAVALVVLSLLIVPLVLKVDSKVLYWPELEAEAYSDAWVFCHQHGDHSARQYNDYVTEYYDDEFLTLVEAFRAFRPVRRVHSLSQASQWVGSVSFDGKNGRNTSFEIQLEEGVYLLRGLSSINTYVYWQLSEEDAATLLAFCNCENHGKPDASQQRICDAEQVRAVTLTRKQEEEITTVLTDEQIESLCTYLQEHLLTRRMDYRYRFGITLSRGGWSADITMTDGSVYRLMYQGPGQYRLLLGEVSEGKSAPDRWIAAELEEENPFATLPDLLEDTP